ncbi:MAG: phenazine biosynthesis protein, partial [Actinobacteria bacterium]
MPKLHVLKVFVGEDGAGGNPLGVFLDGASVPENTRQAIATRLGFSETVFVDDLRSGELRIFTPATELPFAGHPLVGTAWLLLKEGYDVPVLRPPAGEVSVRIGDSSVFVTGRPEWSPPFEVLELPSPEDVDAL